MAKTSYTVNQPNIFGRIGTGIGQGLSESFPKEMERGRLSAGLKALGEKQDLSPFQRFAELAGLPGVTPQIIQSGTDLLRQQAIINSIDKNQTEPRPYKLDQSNNIPVEQGLQTATTAESSQAALKPYIPPTGPEREQMARRLMASEPNIYPNIELARSAIENQIAGNLQQSQAKLAKRELEESVQNRSEQKLREEIATQGAQIPGKVLSNLQKEAVDEVASGKMSPDQAKIKYGDKADLISKDFSNIRSWGNLGILTKKPTDLINSIKSLQKNSRENKYQKEAADTLIGENGFTPQFAYASIYPVSDIPKLNSVIKSLPDISPNIEFGAKQGIIGIAPDPEKTNKTLKIAPTLVKEMGLEGSPLSIGYELEKKGYDFDAWKQYLIDHQNELNLSSHQIDELQKPQPSFFGWLNDWWLKSFSGVK